MKEKEIFIPVTFLAKIGKTTMRMGGSFGAEISIKTKRPLALAYFHLAFRLMGLGLKRILA